MSDGHSTPANTNGQIPALIPRCWVYLMICEGRHKIGKSHDPRKRERSLTQGPFPVRLLHAIETACADRLERWLHRRFEKEHITGEWFLLSEDQVAAFCTVRSCDGLDELPPFLRPVDISVKPGPQRKPKAKIEPGPVVFPPAPEYRGKGRHPQWPPRIKKHSTGQAHVRWRGSNHYLGLYGTETAFQRYRELVEKISRNPDYPGEGKEGEPGLLSEFWR